jgi:hypothetical protein
MMKMSIEVEMIVEDEMMVMKNCLRVRIILKDWMKLNNCLVLANLKN